MKDEAKNISLIVCLSIFLFCILCACSIIIINKIYSYCCLKKLRNKNEEKKVVVEYYLDSDDNLKIGEDIPI